MQLCRDVFVVNKEWTPECDGKIIMNVSLGMKPLWENALGKNWETIMTREKLRALYEKL